jgi:hypothetical protein
MFPNANDPAEVRERRRVEKAIRRWWDEFPTKTADLDAFFRGRSKWDLPGWMNQTLQAIDPHLMWEFGPGPKRGHALAITPEGRRHLRPLVDLILEPAPAIDGWAFFGYRRPVEAEGAVQTVQARTGDDLAGSQVQARMGEHHLLELTYRPGPNAPREKKQAFHAILVLTEYLLGEEMLDHWVGTIEVAKQAEGRWLSLDRLRPTAEALMGSVAEQLPERPLWDDGAERTMTLFQLRPPEADDYPGRRDLIVARSCVPAAWQAAHASSLFHSPRFSRCGETFCYLKLDSADNQRLHADPLQARHELEEALDAALRQEKVGTIVGGGTGRRYAYVDLALTDIRRALQVMRDVVQQEMPVRRGWLQFFDRDLEREWAGLAADSPAPPFAENE